MPLLKFSNKLKHLLRSPSQRHAENHSYFINTKKPQVKFSQSYNSLSMSYQYFALIQPDSNADILALKENLDAFYSKLSNKPTISLQDKNITIAFGSFTFQIFLSEDDSVLEESIEMADDFKTDYAENEFDKEKLKRCSKRFDISGSDDDYDMDYFNDSLFILEQIEKFKGITILRIG